MKHFAEINFEDQGFLIATPILAAVASVIGKGVSASGSLPYLSFLFQCELRVRTYFRQLAAAEARAIRR